MDYPLSLPLAWSFWRTKLMASFELRASPHNVESVVKPMDGIFRNEIRTTRLDGPRPLILTLNVEEQAAVEGWRSANNVPTLEQAVRELLRLGLLSEISKIHSVVTSVRKSVSSEQASDD